MHTTSGVQQGSILGPLLFVCYMNNLPKYCMEMKPSVYEDDSTLLVKGKTLNKINTRLQCNFDVLLDWFAVNKLSINASKTTTVLFCGQWSHFRDANLSTVSGDVSIENIDTMKYPRLHFDRHLTFTEDIDKLLKKVNQCFISQALDKYVYLTLIHPIFTYCGFIYDGTTSTNQNKLQIKQNVSLRAIKYCPFGVSSKRLHDELEIYDLHTCRYKSTLKIVYRGVTNSGPPELDNLFNIHQPNRNLRSQDTWFLLPPQMGLVRTEHDITIRGCRYCNPIPTAIKASTNIDEFKRLIKPYGKSYM